MPVRPLVLVGVVATCLAMTACSTGSQIVADPSTTGTSAPSTVVSPGTSSAASPTSSPSPATASATTTVTAAAATGHCSTIDQATAATILGFATKPGLSSNAGTADPRFMKVDDCLYQSATSGALGYTVVKVDAAIAQSMVQAAKSRMAGAGPQIVVFTTGIPNSIGFTMTLPHGVDSQITAQDGDRLLSLASTRKDGNTAKSQASAIAAMQALIAAG